MDLKYKVYKSKIDSVLKEITIMGIREGKKRKVQFFTFMNFN